MNPYVGLPAQLYGVEEHRLIGGRGDGMRLFEIRNGAGLELTISADRCADLSRVTFKGVNVGYFSPAGYVAPSYYDDRGLNFLRSFTAGFLTTCGLTAAGSPCEDDGEEVPLHGRIANTPAEHVYYTADEREICLYATVGQRRFGGEKMVLHRKLCCPVGENRLLLTDTVENEGTETQPLMMLYHMNVGYPLLDETSVVTIPSSSVAPRDARAAEGIDTWRQMLPPQPGFVEQCYYHTFPGDTGSAQITNRKAGVGLTVTFPTDPFCCFTQWKQMGCREYVLGLEPGNCTPDGRDVLRREGRLQFLEPGERRVFSLTVDFFSV